MSDGRLAILWHLHQPDYRHPISGAPVMPWVRLHSLRGYRDIVLDTLRDDVAVTINVVPSLLDQMLAYAQGQTDRHLELTRRSVQALSPSEREEILGTFVAGHPAMRQVWPDYRALEVRIAAGESLDEDGLRDLQVWSTLAWFGSTAVRDFPEIAALREKGREFTEDDKRVMLGVQESILRSFPDLFRRVAHEGSACLSVSPYYHPILPLLVDTRVARRSLPDAPDESLFAFPEDAFEQLVRARDRAEALLGVCPRGVWPSEGAVSPEVVELMARAGFEWTASDEEVLHRSHRDGEGTAGGWDLGAGLTGFFRDHDLSDRIGFVYSHWDPEDAVRDLLSTASERAGDRVLLVALDGENPWEAWPGAGEAFRAHLHAGLHEGPIRGIDLDHAVERPSVGRVDHLHTGSWIGANLGIWYGHEEDRRAWRLLGEARRTIAEAPEGVRGGALDRLLPAEGSDWTWWYGDEFSTPFDMLFDELFRAHVRAAWEAMGRNPPPALYRHVREGKVPLVAPPRRPLRPKLVEAPAWIHWSGAGRVRWPAGGSMAHGAVHSTGMHFGWSPPAEDAPEGCLWLKIDLPPVLPPAGEEGAWMVHVDGADVKVPYGRVGARAHAEGLEVLAGPRTLVVRADARSLPEDFVPVHVQVLGDGAARYPVAGEVNLPRPGGMDWWRV